MSEPIDLERLWRVFTFDKKRDLKKYCDNAIIHKRDFATLVMACKAGRLPFEHKMHYKDHVPAQLVPSEKEQDALSTNGLGPLKGDALKMMRKMGQLFKDRRYLVGHIFYTSAEWHFFYFDQWDIDQKKGNHWSGGSHVHFINWLWPNYDPQTVWSTFVAGGEPPKGALHIRFVTEQNQPS
jgi:hypothetical protein